VSSHDVDGASVVVDCVLRRLDVLSVDVSRWIRSTHG